MIWKKTTLQCFSLSLYTACTKIQITNSKYNASTSYNRKNAECCTTVQILYTTVQILYTAVQILYTAVQILYKTWTQNECYLLSHYFYCKIINVVLLFYLGRSIADYTISMFGSSCNAIFFRPIFAPFLYLFNLISGWDAKK